MVRQSGEVIAFLRLFTAVVCLSRPDEFNVFARELVEVAERYD